MESMFIFVVVIIPYLFFSGYKTQLSEERWMSYRKLLKLSVIPTNPKIIIPYLCRVTR